MAAAGGVVFDGEISVRRRPYRNLNRRKSQSAEIAIGGNRMPVTVYRNGEASRVIRKQEKHV